MHGSGSKVAWAEASDSPVRMMRRLVLAVFALAGVPLLAAWAISQRVLRPPPKEEDHDLDDFDLPAQEVSFPSRDGTPLAGWFIPASNVSGPAPALVLSHGWSRSRAELLPHADFLHRGDFAVLAFDYRYRGQSGGDAITMGLREQSDLLGALDALAVRPDVDSRRLAVLGMSMGAVIAILVAAGDERVRALVVECPFATQDAIATRALRHYFRLPNFPIAPLTKWVIERRLGEPLDLPEPADVVRELSPRPLFVIADECDAVIGPADALRLFEAAGEPKGYWLIPGADHARGWQAAPQEYERRVLDFVREALGVGGDAQVHTTREVGR